MAHQIECPACGKVYPWVEKFASKKVLCGCGTKIRMPATPQGDAMIVAVSPIQGPASTETKASETKTAPAVARSAAPTVQTMAPAPSVKPPSSPPRSAPAGVPPSPPAPPPPPPPLLTEENLDLDLKLDIEPAVVPSAVVSRSNAAPSPSRAKPAEPEEEQGGYDLALEPPPVVVRPPVRRSDSHTTNNYNAAADPILAEPPPGEGVECPSCGKRFHESAKLCVACGIDIHTGRSFITSDPGDLEKIYSNADSVFRWASWMLVFGIYPFATEAVGGRKAYAVWTITIITVVVSVWFYILMESGSPSMQSAKSLMLWSGKPPDNPDVIHLAYQKFNPQSAMGDRKAYEAKLREVREEAAKAEAAKAAAEAAKNAKPAKPGLFGPRPVIPAPAPTPAPATPTQYTSKKFTHSGDEDEESEEYDEDELESDADESVLVAYNQLTPSEKAFGEFHGYQLITHALLHGGFLHLAGNLLFFLVFGLAVNSLIGNVGTTIIYPLLAIFAGIAHYLDQMNGTSSPMLGASGAIMGMAGMYFVFFPVHRVHCAMFVRPWPMMLLFGISLFLIRYIVYVFKIYMKLFACRGFWILLFYIAFDVYYTMSGAKDGTAHWAHLGGFIAGMAVALILVVTKGVNCRGGDLLTVALGRRAWGLVGKPSQWAEKGVDEGWLQQLRFATLFKPRKKAVEAEAS